MKRRLFTILAALSLLLFVALVVLWVRSAWFRSDQFAVHRVVPPNVRDTWEIETRTTGVQFSRDVWAFNGTISGKSSYSFKSSEDPVADTPAGFRFIGFGYESDADRHEFFGRRTTALLVPYWAIALLLAAAPAILFRSRRHRSPGTCSRCGYDLRATPGRCPECGVVPGDDLALATARR